MFGSHLLQKAQFLVQENSSAILTGVGVIGTVSTAVLTGRASIKAYQIIETNEFERHEAAEKQQADFLLPDLSRSEKAQLIWPVFVPPVLTGGATITCIIMANRINSTKAAAMAAAYGLSEKRFEEYRNKMVEKLGANKETAAQVEIAQERINDNPPGTVIITGGGDVLCYDMNTDRYFLSSVEKIKKAENSVNHEILNHMSCPLSVFYDMIGLRPTTFSDDVGWNTDNLCDVRFSTTTSPDQRPCIAIDFTSAPTTGFSRTY